MTFSRNCFKYLIWIILSVFIFIFLTMPVDAKESNQSSKKTIKSTEASSDSGDTEKDTSADKANPNEEEISQGSEMSMASMSSSGGTPEESVGHSVTTVDTYQFTGAATAKIPIIVPPSMGGIAPNIALTYNSYKKNGWIGVGWDLDMGAIQRSTKRGVDYDADDYVAVVNGSSSELVPRPEWGQNYYGAKIEGGFSKYYKNPAGGWIVTTKDGKTYYYGTSAGSRQDFESGQKVFKWCLDRVEDTNSNYMTITYIKDQGQIYLHRIDYTGNGNLGPDNYVEFHTESRSDNDTYGSGCDIVNTVKRLKTVDVNANGNRVRAYNLVYYESEHIHRSLLYSVQQFGSDALIDDQSKIVIGGTSFPPIEINFSDGQFGFAPRVAWNDGIDYTGYTHITGDFNGDGKTDFMWYSASLNKNFINITTPLSPILVITNISNSHGGTMDIEYKPSSYYKNTLLPFIVHPVSKVTVNDGNGVVSDTSYSYSGGLYDFATREFRGFETVTRTNPDGTTVTTKFHQDEFYKGRQYQIESNEPNAGPLLSKTTLTWDKEFLDAPENTCAFVKLSQKRTESYDNVTVYTQEVHTYDNTNGNLLTTVTTGTDAETITKTNQYQNFGDWLWRLTQETVEGSTSGKVRESFYGYETDTGNLLSKEFWLNTGANPSVTYTYDTYGNMITETDARGNTTTTEYETTTYTFPQRIIYPETNGVSHIVENEAYDYRYGKVTISKDENGNRTYYDYDEFGRPKQVDFPDGGQATTEYFDDVFPRYMITKLKEDVSGNTIDKHEYFDGLGRTIQTITFGENNKSIVTKMFYDEMGRNYRVEGPFFSTGTGYPKTPPPEYPWVETEYDYRGRPIEVESPDGQYGTVLSTISYSGFSTTTTDPDGSQKTEKKDYLGRLIQVTEYAETEQYITTYAYNAAGDMLNVTDHLGNVTTINYDTLGRKINMTDPDMGYWAYTYDANGNLLTQTDAKGQIITFSYDELNRVAQKVYSTSDPTVTYVYDNLSISNGRGKLYSVSNTNVTTTYNSYDTMGRETSVSKTITGDPTVYTTLHSYDLSGKLISTTYPDSYQVNTYYYPGTGLLSSVVGITDLTEYAELTGYQPTGKIGQMDHGNNTSTTYTYDPKSTRLTTIISKDSDQIDVQNRTYGYSPAGDIEQIIDNKDSITYTYGYDYLHRLTSETNTGSYDPITHTYNAVGNITSKIVGTSTYNYTYASSSHKHAVSSINYNGNNYNYTYDDNGNMTGGPDFSNPGQVNSRTITFNADNMPTVITHNIGGTTNLTYDGSGNRAKKSIQGGGTTYYVGEHYEVINGTATKYIFAGNLRIAMVSTAGTSYFHKDHLGSSTVMTDAAGLTVEITIYMPFGHMRAHTGTVQTHYKFTDQELDPESGLYNYGARLYDPVIGRFITPDIFVQFPFNPQTLNRYSYCLNNPLIYVDPSGHFLGAIIGAVIGAVVAGIQSDWDLDAVLKGSLVGAVSGGVGEFIGVQATAAYAEWAGVTASSTPALMAGAIAGGTAAGATAGGLNASMYGDFGDAILEGAGWGALGGAVFGAIGVHYGSEWNKWRIIAHGMAGGGLSELSGGSFEEGGMFALATSLCAIAFQHVVNELPSGAPGGKAVPKSEAHDLQRASQKNNNMLLANKNSDNMPESWFHEGSKFSKFLNRVRTFNAIGTFHDNFGSMYISETIWNSGMNFVTALPAAAVTYSAFAANYNPAINFEIYRTLHRR